jgi:hypothetical protein
MKVFGWSPEYCRKGITSAESWIWYNWARENEMTMMGALWQRSGKGYVAQESDRIAEQLRKLAKT